MARKPYVFTPARQRALAKARAASVLSRQRARARRNRGRAPLAANRGIGVKGLKKNTIPYVRANKRSQTLGANAGTIIPGTGKRLVIGGYARLENTSKKNAVDKALANVGNSIFPRGTARGRAKKYFRENVTVTNPAMRAKVGGSEVRLGTSRGSGPTVILRRGRHKVSQNAARKAIKRYDTQARKLNSKRQPKPRPQRRKASRG